MIVRDERPSDRAAVAALLEAAFGQASEARLVEQLHGDGDVVIALIAAEQGVVVGHVLLSRLDAPFRALGLAPLAVSPDRQRAGIGTALVRAALDRAQRDGWQAVFVLGDDYYRRFGFDPALASGFGSPYAGPHFMALSLGGDLAVTSGEIVHAPAFAAL